MPDIRAPLTRAREAANDIAFSAGEKIKEGTGKARDGASELVQTGREKAAETYADARDRTQRAATRANQIVQDHPVMAVAGAVAAGAVIAWMFPKSRRAMKALPGIATAAGTRLAETAIAARAAAAERAQTIKDSASDMIHAAGDAASQARETAAASDLSNKASKLAEDVIALVSTKVDAVGEAIKARLPKS
ncbi:ElaB/YqjD/DUF883 family membrane-anchored ribosome-binding protein [Sphingobium sp. OAS761]|uniref:hypothetical protein n=1 Tax=Sphingobium sp. OAS761 TaxID=2817901 RepID=UPI00209DF450|nr:hypothetical protein [Sphingobium sp. OAS761]MCP1470723.1 ElaB/YqjD/DUF883 family membrane-anchored ribosome-binding protein [Sphingobium sp. OAS761]